MKASATLTLTIDHLEAIFVAFEDYCKTTTIKSLLKNEPLSLREKSLMNAMKDLQKMAFETEALINHNRFIKTIDKFHDQYHKADENSYEEIEALRQSIGVLSDNMHAIAFSEARLEIVKQALRLHEKKRAPKGAPIEKN